MSAIAPAAAPVHKAPLYLLAGCHGSLHWALATFYILLPFIQQHLGLNYAETGLLASMVHVASLAMNVPSGMLVDVTGRRVACQLTALVLAGLGLAALGQAGHFWTVVLIAALVAAMNTLWHPAAISYLSAHYRERRGLALSFHTVGASFGDALAPVLVGACVTVAGWQAGAVLGALPALLAGALLWLYFGRQSDGGHRSGNADGRGMADYLASLRAVLRDRQVWGVCLMAGLRGTCQVGLRAFLPLYVVNELGATAVWVGIVIFLYQGGGLVATPAAGYVSDRLGRRTVLISGLLTAAVLVTIMPNVSQPWLYAGVVALAGASLMSLRPVVQGWALDLTPLELGGTTISIVFGVQAAFAMVVPVVSGLAADRWGLAVAFYLFAGAALAAAVVAAFVAGPSRR